MFGELAARARDHLDESMSARSRSTWTLGSTVGVATRVKGRFALLTVGRLFIGGACLFRALELYRAASSSSLLSLLFLLVGVTLLWWGAVGARALLSGNGAKDDVLIENSVADVDRRAPSGLKPLWIALGSVLGAFLLWVLIAGLIGAT